MPDIPDSGSSVVYIGFWTDHDGHYLLTLTNQNAAALLSFLAVAVTFAGNRSWKICRFATYSLLSRRRKSLQDTTSHSAIRVVLRNSSTAGSTLWSLSELFRDSRRKQEASETPLVTLKGRKISTKRTFALGSISIAHMAGFIIAGILTSQSLVGSIALSRAGSSCGQWLPIGVNTKNTPAYMSPSMFDFQLLRLNETFDSDNYVRNCYPLGVSRGILDCGKLYQRHMPYTLEHNIGCPFSDELCKPRPDGAFLLDSGRIAFRELGINSKWARDLYLQRRSKCAVIPDTPFIEEETEGFARSYRMWYDHTNDGLPAFWYINDTISGTWSLSAWRTPSQPVVASELLRSDPYDHDLSLILLRSNGIYFPRQFDDPWFSVHKPFDNSSGRLATGLTRYEIDNFLNIIACQESRRLCSTLSGRCNDWGPIVRTDISRAWLDLAELMPPGLQNGTSDYNDIAHLVDFVGLASLYTSIPDSIGYRPASSALQAARYLQDDVQTFLEPEQWKLELEYWFAMGLARMQLEILNIVEKPPGIDDSIVYNAWAGEPIQKLCGAIKFRSPDHTSLSTVGIIVILAVVALLMLGSVVDTVLDWIPAPWAKNLVAEWNRLENLKLLEDAEKQ